MIFIAGDDAEAKEIVGKLIEEIGFAAVDTGVLREGGEISSPDTAIYNKTLTAKAAKRAFGFIRSIRNFANFEKRGKYLCRHYLKVLKSETWFWKTVLFIRR